MLKKFSQFIKESRLEDEPYSYDEPGQMSIERDDDTYSDKMPGRFDRERAKALLSELSERSIDDLRRLCKAEIDKAAPGPMTEAFGMYHADREGQSEGSDNEALMELSAMVTDAESASRMLALIDTLRLHERYEFGRIFPGRRSELNIERAQELIDQLKEEDLLDNFVYYTVDSDSYRGSLDRKDPRYEERLHKQNQIFRGSDKFAGNFGGRSQAYTDLVTMYYDLKTVDQSKVIEMCLDSL